MKTRTNSQIRMFLAAVLAGSLALPAFAESKNKLDSEIRDLADYFETVQKEAQNAVPAEILSKAQGIIIMRNYKAGFIVGVSGGSGVSRTGLAFM